MAKAPTPGVGKKVEAAKQARKVARLTLRGQTLTLAAGNLPMGEKLAVLRALDMSYDDVITKGGEEAFCVMWWLARRANGEPNLPFQSVVTWWPDDLDVSSTSTEIDVAFVEAQVTDDDPEA